MADILIAYTVEDREAARACGEVLARQGYDVEWESPIPKRLKTRSTIRPQAAAAKAIIVIWSAASVRSRVLQREAEIAAATGRLIATHVKASVPRGLAGDLQGFVVGSVNDPKPIVEALQALGISPRRTNGRGPERSAIALPDATLAGGAWAFVDGRGDPELIHHFMRR